MICNIQDPITREDYTPRSAERGPQGGQLPEEHRALPTRPTSARKPSSSSSTTSASTRTPHEGLLPRRQHRRASGIGAATKSPNLGYKLRHKEGYFPVPPADQMMDIRNEMMQTHDRLRAGRRMPAPRSRHGRPGGNRPAVRRAGRDGRRHVAVQVHHQERGHASTTRRSPSCPSRSSATTAAACTRTSRCGRTASRCLPAAATPG